MTFPTTGREILTTVMGGGKVGKVGDHHVVETPDFLLFFSRDIDGFKDFVGGLSEDSGSPAMLVPLDGFIIGGLFRGPIPAKEDEGAFTDFTEGILAALAFCIDEPELRSIRSVLYERINRRIYQKSAPEDAWRGYT
ncbi:hypothetical protein [Candidatus Methanocrinis natronophilus]|uniref:Uncharacterized protein n=1 Tax=Candidatus Methanocrinis natronophilus TaxID=3033396 RepID=A0ABT5XAJ0_9EURY|nr:hypothetical protein [Candidatus Methanocrinis natronophilus]MDF0591677.1 hypothetical protein [Candidatus Methanocrinis natronophilus]